MVSCMPTGPEPFPLRSPSKLVVTAFTSRDEGSGTVYDRDDG